MPVFYMSIYNKDGSTFINKIPNDTLFTITSTGITAENHSTTIDFSNSNVIGYANTPNATTPDYPIGATSINIGTETENNSIYEVEVDEYTINVTKPKITINCQDKTMKKDLVIKFNSKTVKKLLDARKSASHLFESYKGTLVDDLISYDDVKNVTNMQEMFNYCSSLTTIPLLNTSKVQSMANMFYNCTALTTIPLLDTSNVTNMTHMFFGCNSLTTIPALNTSKVQNMYYMFTNCKALTTIPLLDTSNVTNMEDMFSNCSALTTIPHLNTSKVMNMRSMFYNCTALTTVPLLDTTHTTGMSYMFYGCSSLTEIPAFNVRYLNDNNSMFNGCSSLTAIHMTGMAISFDISASTLFTTEALHEIIDNLATVSSSKTLTMGSTNLAKVSEEHITIANNKGWTLA